MKKLYERFIQLVAAIISLAIAGAFTLTAGFYITGFLCFAALIYISVKLYSLNIRTTEQFKFFSDSVKFSESNISFKSDISNETYLAFYNSLSSALEQINLRSRKREAEINFYNNLLNRIDFALVVTDKRGKIVWTNKFALDLLGRPAPANIMGFKKIPDLREVLDEVESGSTKILKITYNGRQKSLVVNFSRVTIRGEELNLYSMKDVQPVVDETEGAAWQQLISVMTHEIMNSLTPIISLSETFSEHDNEPELINKAMQTIRRRSSGLVEFVKNYKKLAQIPAPQCSNIKVKPFIEDVVELMKGEGYEISVLITSSELVIFADRVQMEQVLINLLKNACEACTNSPEPKITVTVLENNYGQIVITVRDNGCGMDPETLEKIFTPFFTTKPTGSGLGLSICRQIVSLHGGTLTATSNPGEGSMFAIKLWYNLN